MKPSPDIISALTTLLSNGDALDRCCACRCLGIIAAQKQHAGVLPALIERLRDDDIDVCIDAAEALGQLGDSRAVEALITSLQNDPDADVRVAAIEALGRLGGEQAMAELIAYVSTATDIDDWDDDEGWDRSWDIQRTAIQALGQQRAAAAVPALSALLDEEDSQADESDVILALARIGGDGVKVVIQRLQNRSARERRRAAHALGQVTAAHAPGQVDAARALGRALQDPAPDVRAVAAEALANGGHVQYLRALLLLLRDPAADVRETALRAVAKLSHSSNTDLDHEKLLPLLNDPSARIRAGVLHVLLGQSTDTLDPEHAADLQTHILQRLTDADPAVAAAAIPHAHALHEPQVNDILLDHLRNPQSDARVRQQAARALGQRAAPNAEILAALNDAIDADNSLVCWAALQALMQLHLKHPQSAQTAHQDTPTPETPLALILAAVAAESAPENLQKPSEDSSAGTAEPPAETPAETPAEKNADEPPPATTSTLAAILQANQQHAQQSRQQSDTHSTLAIDDSREPLDKDSDEDHEEFQALYDILAQQKQNRKKFYRRKDTGTVSNARLLSVRILGECSQPEVVKALHALLRDTNPELQQEAVNALARIMPDTPGLQETLGPLASFLTLGSADLQIASARTLGAIGNLGSLDSLLAGLHDSSPLLRSQSVQAISQILERHATNTAQTNNLPVRNKRQQKEDAQIETALLSLSASLSDPDVGVRKTAALSLAKLEKPLQHSQARDEIMQRLITAAFIGEGEQARDMGQALRALYPLDAGEKLLQQLGTLASSQRRRFALEMLEEIFRPQPTA